MKKLLQKFLSLFSAKKTCLGCEHYSTRNFDGKVHASCKLARKNITMGTEPSDSYSHPIPDWCKK
jgi:hypothetical protein